MTGSVVASATGKETSGAKRRRVGGGGGRSRAKAKAAATPADGMSSLVQSIPPESNMESTTVATTWGVRVKYWIDDLVMCTNHTIGSLQSELRDVVDETVFTETKRELLRLGLLFAFTGEITIATHKTPAKTYRKWSSVRPSLKGHAVLLITKAGFGDGAKISCFF